MIARPLALSVVVPARNAAPMLPLSLTALLRSDLAREEWELIVIDDASTDATAQIAREYADVVVELPTPRPLGPAYARNRGCDVARGEIIAFVDADVCVHADSLRRFIEAFRADGSIGAVFGSYDAHPPEPGLVSQYRNLLHHHVHQRSGGDAETFWAGCGAVRRSVFLDAGMFDDWHYPRPQIEDIELGARIRALGHRILLRPDIQATHCKRWTLGSVIRTDLLDRGVPWTRLLVQQGSVMRVATLNLKRIEKAKTALVWAAIVLAILAWPMGDARWLFGAMSLLLVVIAGSVDLYRSFVRARGLRFAIATVPLHMLYYVVNGLSVALGWLMHHAVGEPRPDPVVDAFAEVGVEHDPPLPSRRQSGPWGQAAIR